jgi:hypothetical protein
MAGISAGVSAGPAYATGSVTGLGLTSNVGAVRAAGHVGAPFFDARSGSLDAASGPTPWQAVTDTAAANRLYDPRVPVRAASAGRPAQQVASQHEAGSQHPATSQQPAPAQHAAPAQQQAPAQPARPYLIYDSVTPSAIPAHRQIATYATGGYAVSPSQLAGRGPVLWIDTTGTDPAASALDVEPGDVTPSGAASWVWQKLHTDPNGVAIVYTMRSEWSAVQAAVGTLPSQMRSHVRWWIADPTGVPHVVPGSNATQWYWGTNYDISTADPGF